MERFGWAPSLERVLCPLDVQQPTLSALKLASSIADRFGASLEALYVGSNATSAGLGTLLNNAGRVGELITAHNAEQHLRDIVRTLECPVVPTAHFMLGSPVSAILERASTPAFDLIVLGARQRSDLGWQFRNDVARQVAALATCATLTVHERDTPSTIKRVLLPVDFTLVTTQTLHWAAAFAAKFGGEVQLLHVVSREQSTVRSLDRERNVVRSSMVPTDVSGRLTELEQTLKRLGVVASSQAVIASDVANGIADYNDRGEFDLIVVGESGPPQSPPRLTRGVVATLRNRMSVPVLSVRCVAPDSSRSASG